ncbi:MAG: TVP38/TMEM64 family protein [Clostridiales bacterium]|nr:TVP38/TMEM64 family protein [Clostridiales bacterium]
MSPKNQRRSLWPAALLAVVLFTAVVLLLQFPGVNIDDFAAQYKNKLIALPILAGVYLLKTVTVILIPQPAVYLMTGLLFSPVPAFLITLLLLSMEIGAGYFLGKKIGKKWLNRLLNWLQGRSRFLDRALKSDRLDSFSSLMLFRLMPGMPIDPISLLAGARESRFAVYFTASLLGAAPKAVAMSLMGSSAHDPLSPEFLIPMGALAAVFLGAVLIKKRIGKQKEASGDAAQDGC